jgi:subtilisin family serine protease
VVNASAAYARGATGSGVTIGITDSGLDETHVEFSSLNISNDSYTCNNGSPCLEGNYQPNTYDLRHGTWVASVAAGPLNKGNNGIHGVAFDAEILFIAIRLGSPTDDYDPVDIGDDDGSGNVTNAPDFTGIDSFFAQLFNIYNSYDVDIVNNSYGYSGNIIDFTEAQVRYAFPKTIAEMSQIGTPDSLKTIYVWAAGNAGGYADQGVDYSSPEILPGMAHYITEIQGHSIAVASVDENGQISNFSSRCGVAQDYCIAAPGGDISAPYPTSVSDIGFYSGNKNDENYSNCIQDNSCYARGISGTSFAAPFVSGGLAVIDDYFEGQLGSKEIVDRLFGTANKEGVYSDKAIYGQGLMDLDAATAPVGQVSAMLTGSLSGAMVPALFTGIQLTSPSFGDAVSNGVANQTIIFFDELDAPFRGAVENLTTDYRNQIVNLDGYEHMYQSTPQIIDSPDNVLEMSNYKNKNLSYGLISSRHLLEAQQDSNQFFTYFNKGNNGFVSHGINGSWALGIFQDKDLRYKSQLRSQFSNPWLNFSAGGTSFGSVYKFQHHLDVAFLISSGRNRFQGNEIFGESNSSTVAMIELQPKNTMPSIQFGVLKENDSNLGLSGSGAFNGNGGQMTSFVGISDSMSLFGGKFFSSLYIGNSPGTSNNEGMINSITDIQSSAFGMGFLKQSIFDSGDELLLSIDQPMRTESGEMNLRVPVYRTKERSVLFNSFGFTLRPSGREVHSKARYMSSYKNIGLSLTLGYKSDPYHIKSMEDYWYTALGFSIKI